jgi:hypothetical protein
MISKPILDWMRSERRAQSERNTWNRIYEHATREVNELRRSLTLELVTPRGVVELPNAYDKAFIRVRPKQHTYAESMFDTGQDIDPTYAYVNFRAVRRSVCYRSRYGAETVITWCTWEPMT